MIRQFFRSTMPYQYFYVLLKETLNKQIPEKFLDYNAVDWMRIGSHTVLIRVNDLAAGLSPQEYELITTQRSAELSDQRLEELRLLFWFLAKIQSDQDLMNELEGK